MAKCLGMFRRDLRTVVDIEAPPERVWQVLTDVSHYPEWNPMVHRVVCPQGLVRGASITLSLEIRGQHFPRIPARVSVFEPDRAFAWKGGIAGLQTGEHYFVVHPWAGGTRVIHGERWNGLLVPPALMLLGRHLFDGYRQLNRALAERCRVVN